MKYFVSIACSLLLIGCGDSAPTETVPAVQNEAPSAVTAPAVESNVSAPAAVETKAPEPVAPVVEKAEPKPSAAAPAKTAAVAKAPAAGVDGSAVFAQKCASCHGMKAEKAALGKSQVIAGWSEQQVKDALKGYQAGTYGKEMKALMQGQAKGLDDATIDALAAHIAKQ